MRKVLTPGSGLKGQTFWAMYLQNRRRVRKHVKGTTNPNKNATVKGISGK